MYVYPFYNRFPIQDICRIVSSYWLTVLENSYLKLFCDLRRLLFAFVVAAFFNRWAMIRMMIVMYRFLTSFQLAACIFVGMVVLFLFICVPFWYPPWRLSLVDISSRFPILSSFAASRIFVFYGPLPIMLLFTSFVLRPPSFIILGSFQKLSEIFFLFLQLLSNCLCTSVLSVILFHLSVDSVCHVRYCFLRTLSSTIVNILGDSGQPYVTHLFLSLTGVVCPNHCIVLFSCIISWSMECASLWFFFIWTCKTLSFLCVVVLLASF